MLRITLPFHFHCQQMHQGLVYNFIPLPLKSLCPLQVALEIAEAITPVKPPIGPGPPSSPISIFCHSRFSPSSSLASSSFPSTLIKYVPGIASTPRQDRASKNPAHSGGTLNSLLATSTPDQRRKVSAKLDEEERNLNNTAGSNAFSADGSFMDL